MPTQVQLILIEQTAHLLEFLLFCGLIFVLSRTKIWERITLKCKLEKGMYFEFGVQKDRTVKKAE